MSYLDRALSKLKSAKIIPSHYDSDEGSLDDIAQLLTTSAELLLMYSLGLRGVQIDHNSDFQILIAGLEKAGGHVPGWIKENYYVLQDWALSSWDGRSVIATLEQIEEVIPVLKKWCASSTLEERNPGNP